MPWHQAKTHGKGEELVICLHGLWRSLWAMDPLAKQCIHSGFSCINLPYPSFRNTLEQMVERLDLLIQQEAPKYSKIHLLTHSLGGVIARRYLDACGHDKCSKVLMIAPPLRGSMIVDWLGHSPLLRVLGPAGDFLSTANMGNECSVISQDVESAVIMGNKVKIPLFQHVIEGENDGIVRVEAGMIEGLDDFKIVHADHTFITSHPEVLVSTDRFLRTGKL
ncbi:MAG: alpha/beta fold hydrolase [Rubritalea sp.]|uniref:alpha/beta fold hydrolase n=1 Tax=Rubritalea sp. TaxID=2109375 RepID=UPI0032425884